jgi:lipopolysaccharide biosynthesis regulator YciM
MDLAEKVRDQAQYELGQDYLKAGLLDRAEEVFTRLAPTALASRAAFCRLEIAQTERDWPRAIALGREWLAIPIERLEIAEREKRQVVAQWIVHFYCEQVSEAALLAAAAMPEGERHPRVLQLTAEFARQRGDFAAAVAAWMVLGEAAPIYLAPVAPQVLDDWRNAGRLEEGIHWLEDCHQREPSSDFVQAIARSRLALNGLSAAQTWATRALAERPSLRGLESLLALREGSTPNGQPANAGGASSALSDALIRQLMRPQLQRVARYRCLQCGFEGRQFHWHCPGCHRWASCSPRRVEEIQG